jgi:hypothetical protein
MFARNLWNANLRFASASRTKGVRPYCTSHPTAEVYYPKNGNAHLPGGLDQYKIMHADSIKDPAAFWGKVGITNMCTILQ